MRYDVLKNRALGTTCRRCINKKYALELEPADCIYLPYMYPCKKCGEMRNIVGKLRWRSRIKLWGEEKRRKARQATEEAAAQTPDID